LIVSLPTVIEQGRKEIKPRYKTKQQYGQNNRGETLIRPPNAQAEIFTAQVEKLAEQNFDAGHGNQ